MLQSLTDKLLNSDLRVYDVMIDTPPAITSTFSLKYSTFIIEAIVVGKNITLL